MILGSPINAGLGSPESMIDYVNAKLVSANSQIEIAFRPRADYGDAYFGIYRNARFVRNLYAPEAQETVLHIDVPPGETAASILVLRLGGMSDTTYSIERVARTFETANAQRATIRWNWPIDVLGTPENADLTLWSLTGLRYRQAFHPPHQATRGILKIDVTVAGGNATVTVKSGNQKLAEGTGAVGGSVTLTQQNDSGVSGSVTVAADVATSTNDDLYVRWPKEMRILRGASPSPTTLVKTISFNRSDKARWTEESDLAADTYFYRVQPTADSGETLGGFSATVNLIIPATPDPPSSMAYSSGAAANTVVSFTASPTAGATYRAYVQNPGGAPPNMDLPDATASAGATTIALPAITGFPGTARVWVRAVSGSIEERNNEVLEIEYDAGGARVTPRPNDASLIPGSILQLSGKQVKIDCVYDPADEKSVATQVRLFSRVPSGSYNFSSPEDTQTLVAGPTGMKTAQLTVTQTFSGFHFLTAKAFDASGQESVTQAQEVLTYVTLEAATAPTIEVFQSRG